MSSGATLNQVAELVRTLALGWKNLAAYPAGHPALVASFENIQHRLADLRGPAGEVVLGIGAEAVIYGDDKLESTYAQKFAQALYTRGVAVVRFDTNTELSDIETFLRLLGVGFGGEQARPIWEELTAAGVANINLQPVDYSAVKVTDTLEKTSQKPEAAWLWEEIVRALANDRELSEHARQMISQEVHSVDELATLILRYMNDLSEKPTRFDPDATFGVRLGVSPSESEVAAQAIAAKVADAIGASVAGATGANRQVALQQVVKLLRVLPDSMRGAVLRSVMRTLVSDETAGGLLRDFASELPQDEVLDALRHLSTLTKLSSHAIALLQSLAVIEKPVIAPAEVPAELVSNLVTLFGEDDVDRFNPPEHQALLEHVSVQVPPLSRKAMQAMQSLGERVDTIADAALNRQLARTLLDLLSTFGTGRQTDQLLARLEKIFAEQLRTGSFADGLRLIEQLQEISVTTASTELRLAIDASYGRLASAEMIQALIGSLLTAPPSEIPTIHQLIESLGTSATRSLLSALAEENNRSRRRKLFDFVASLGSVIVPEVTRMLDDSRWYVVRNMIALLRAVGDRTALPPLHKLAQHPDMRVRLEAIRTLLALDPSVPRGLLNDVINSSDVKMAETAIGLVGNYGIKEGVDPLLHMLSARDLFGSRKAVRVRAIKALGELADARALPRLEKFFKDSILPWPAREERLAAYESLGGYPTDARAKLVERGLKSRDPLVREICKRLNGHS